jgi:DNA-binding transcriptional LysR family regulator
MSLTKSTSVDQITVTERGIVLYREATRIMEDGNQLSETYHRSSLTPGQDLTGIPANVVAHCNVAWTAEVIAAYQAQVAEQAAKYAAPAESALEQPAEATQATDPAA